MVMPEISLSCPAPRNKAAIYKTVTASTLKELEQNLKSPRMRVLPLFSPASLSGFVVGWFFLIKERKKKHSPNTALQTRAPGTLQTLGTVMPTKTETRRKHQIEMY